MEQSSSTPAADLQRIIESARRLGVELDEAEALQWLTALAADQGEEIVMDERAGVFGHRVTMLDFSPADLEHFRRIGRLVEFKDEPGRVETALALSGSSAQSKIQTYPGDADYFERVNLLAPTRAEACALLARIMRQKIMETLKGPTYQFIEAKFGSYPQEVVKSGKRCAKGAPIAWTADEAAAGQIEAFTPTGEPVAIKWEQAAAEPGWCKLDWVVADPQRGQLANASNMLDVTWEAPDGTITPLDGYLDPYFQEVYLEAGSVPIFSKLAQHVSANALDEYVEQLQKEVNNTSPKTSTTAKPPSACTTSSASPGASRKPPSSANSSMNRPPCSTRSGRSSAQQTSAPVPARAPRSKTCAPRPTNSLSRSSAPWKATRRPPWCAT